MEKSDFILIADKLIAAKPLANDLMARAGWHAAVIAVADAMKEIDPQFMRYRWLGYIAGENGPSGGSRTVEHDSAA